MEPLALEPLFPDRTTGEPLSRQLVRRLRTAIQSGAIPPRSRIMSTRELARCLGIARNTVASAIEQLVAEGFLDSHVGCGTFVAADLRPLPRANTPARTSPETAQRIVDESSAADPLFVQRGVFQVGTPDSDAFPVRAWQTLLRRHLGSKDCIAYPPAGGLPRLREAIAAHVRQYRGLATQASDVIVTSGTQGALTLASLVLAAPQDAAIVEDPGYPLARAAFAVRGLKTVPVHADDEGIVVNCLPRAKLAYVTPAHQFPLGGTLSLSRRITLLDWARTNDAYILEDEYDSEFAFESRPLPPLQSLDREGRVIYLGSFSKTLAPGLRLGYMLVPPHLRNAFERASLLLSMGQPPFVQAALAEFIENGSFARNIRRIASVYRARRDALISALKHSLPTPLRIGSHAIGLHLALMAPAGFDDSTFCASLPSESAALSLSSLCVSRDDCKGLVLGYGSSDAGALCAAVTKLAAHLNF